MGKLIKEKEKDKTFNFFWLTFKYGLGRSGKHFKILKNDFKIIPERFEVVKIFENFLNALFLEKKGKFYKLAWWVWVACWWQARTWYGTLDLVIWSAILSIEGSGDESAF